MGSPVLCQKCFTYNTDDTDFCNKCGSPLEEKATTIPFDSKSLATEDMMIFSPGEKFGKRYRIIEEVGRGGMGRVYKAEDLELHTTVALKMIRKKLSQNPRFIDRFKKEMIAARSISHENVVRVHDLGEENGIKYISMDFIRGQNLKDFIRASGPITITKAIDITQQICYGLKAAHKHGIIHTDLKPSNIMIDNNGSVYLMDFGLARTLSGLQVEKPKTFRGTPQYASPEQAMGDRLDNRSDIYAVGLIMFEMLTGKPAFAPDRKSVLLDKQISEIPPLASSINPNIPAYVVEVIARCLKKDRDARYPDIQSLLHDLKREEKASSAGLLKAKKTKMPLVLIAVLMAIVLGAYIFIKLFPKAPPAAKRDKLLSVAILYFENNTGDSSLDFLSNSITNLAIFDMSQSRLIRPITEDRLVNVHNELSLGTQVRYSTENLQRIARMTGADYVFPGNFHRIGDRYVVNARLYQTNPWRQVAALTCDGVDQFKVADQISLNIKRAVDLPESMIAADIDRNVGEIITASTEALNFYYEGKRLYEEVKFKESNDAYLEAIRYDPGFAMAYKKISFNYSYLRDLKNSRAYIEKAIDHIDRTSERERLLILAYYAQYFGESINEAIRFNKELLELYPDDIEGNIQLGSVYRNLEEWDLSFDRFEQVLISDKSNMFGVMNQAFIYSAKGLYYRAEELLRENQHVFPDKAFYYQLLCNLYRDQGKFDSAFMEVEALHESNPDSISYHLLKGFIHQTTDDFERAAQEYEEYMKNATPDNQLRGRYWGILNLLPQGKTGQAIKEAESSLKVSQKQNNLYYELDYLFLLSYLCVRTKNYREALGYSEQLLTLARDMYDREKIRWAYLFKGMSYAYLDDLPSADTVAQQLKDCIESSGCRKFIRQYHYLMGTISMVRDQFSQARDYLEMAWNSLSCEKQIDDSHAFYLNLLAASTEAQGDDDGAIEFYERLASLNSGKLFWGDIYTLSYYRLGLLYQKQNRVEKSIHNFEKFLSFWSDAEFGALEREKANKELIQLRIPEIDRNPE